MGIFKESKFFIAVGIMSNILILIYHLITFHAIESPLNQLKSVNY